MRIICFTHKKGKNLKTFSFGDPSTVKKIPEEHSDVYNLTLKFGKKELLNLPKTVSYMAHLIKSN